LKKCLLAIAVVSLLSSCAGLRLPPDATAVPFAVGMGSSTATHPPSGATGSPTHTPCPTATKMPTCTPAATAMPANTPTGVPTDTPMPTASPAPTAGPTLTRELSPKPAPALVAGHPDVPPLVLANYFPWYDPATWDTGCTSDGDRPLDGVYDSNDPAVISRHIEQARAAGLDGFAVHWFAREDRTDANARQVLDLSPEGFNSTITFLYHILPGAKVDAVIEQLRYVHRTYGGHPRFLRLAGRPVILFSDMYRVPDRAGRRPKSDQDVATAVAHWAEIRAAVDPHHEDWWIAEGLRPEYLEVFDGLYVYRIDHACCPNACLSAPRWAGKVREWERATGQAKLWVGTVMPGWDDLNSGKSHCTDLRVSAEPFARGRADGSYYARTWEAVLPTGPDLVVVHSFNEWVEGSYVEPSERFGDLYLRLTAQWVTRFKTRR